MAVGGIGELVSATNRIMPRLDCIANNISNMGTSGYKADMLYYLKEKDASSGGTGVKATPLMVVDFSQGSLVATGNPLDIAVKRSFNGTSGGRLCQGCLQGRRIYSGKIFG